MWGHISNVGGTLVKLLFTWRILRCRNSRRDWGLSSYCFQSSNCLSSTVREGFWADTPRQEFLPHQWTSREGISSDRGEAESSLLHFCRAAVAQVKLLEISHLRNLSRRSLASGISSSFSIQVCTRSKDSIGHAWQHKQMELLLVLGVRDTCCLSFSNVHSWFKLISRSLFSLTSDKNTPNAWNRAGHWSTMWRRRKVIFDIWNVTETALLLTFSKEYSFKGILNNQKRV